MLFSPEPKSSLEDAIRMVSEAVAIAYQYQYDHQHLPSEQELKLIDELSALTGHVYTDVKIAARQMHARARQQP